MSITDVADLAGAVLVALGAFLCFSAAVGLVRFPDILTRMHAATKPQTLGLLLIVLGVAVSLREPAALGMLFLIAVLQLMTAPVSAHMVARAAYRSNQVENGAITTDELAEDLARAGFALQEADEDADDSLDVGEAGEPGADGPEAEDEAEDEDEDEAGAGGEDGEDLPPADPPSRRAVSDSGSDAGSGDRGPERPAPEDDAPEEILDAEVPPETIDEPSAARGPEGSDDTGPVR